MHLYFVCLVYLFHVFKYILNIFTFLSSVLAGCFTFALFMPLVWSGLEILPHVLRSQALG